MRNEWATKREWESKVKSVETNLGEFGCVVALAAAVTGSGDGCRGRDVEWGCCERFPLRAVGAVGSSRLLAHAA